VNQVFDENERLTEANGEITTTKAGERLVTEEVQDYA
jgi:hypothetical protein